MKLKLTVDGKVYEVEVDVAEPEQPHPSYVPPANKLSTPPSAGARTSPSATGAAPVDDESKVCRSPVAGVIVRMSAQVGQTIQPHDVLMVLEAMKMETEITSPIAGTVAKVNAQVGDSVKSGQVLVEFE